MSLRLPCASGRECAALLGRLKRAVERMDRKTGDALQTLRRAADFRDAGQEGEHIALAPPRPSARRTAAAISSSIRCSARLPMWRSSSG
jgi:hypothetical protein